MSRLLKTTGWILAAMLITGILSPLKVRAVEGIEERRAVPTEEAETFLIEYISEEEVPEILMAPEEMTEKKETLDATSDLDVIGVIDDKMRDEIDIEEPVMVFEVHEETISQVIAFADSTTMNVSGKINASTLKNKGVTEDTILLCTNDLDLTMDTELYVQGIVAVNNHEDNLWDIPYASGDYNVTIRGSGKRLVIGKNDGIGFIKARNLTIDGGIIWANPRIVAGYGEMQVNGIISAIDTFTINSGTIDDWFFIEAGFFKMNGGNTGDNFVFASGVDISNAMATGIHSYGNLTIKNSTISPCESYMDCIEAEKNVTIENCNITIGEIASGGNLKITNSDLNVSEGVYISKFGEPPTGTFSVGGKVTSSGSSEVYIKQWHDYFNMYYDYYRKGFAIKNANGGFEKARNIIVKGKTSTASWIKSNGKWWYRNADGTYPKNQWKNIDGKWYYFDNSGWMKTGWTQVKGKWYYLNSGGVMQTGWVKSGGKWYYLNDSGVMMKGWQKVGGKWYYMNSSGVMQTGWLLIGKNYYYLESSGAMKTGWLQLGSSWYWFDPSGLMAKYWTPINNQWYYFNAAGVMQTGWVRSGSNWYYTNSSGVMQTGWLSYNGNLYYLMENGAMVANKTLTIDGIKYTFNAGGIVTSRIGDAPVPINAFSKDTIIKMYNNKERVDTSQFDTSDPDRRIIYKSSSVKNFGYYTPSGGCTWYAVGRYRQVNGLEHDLVFAIAGGNGGQFASNIDKNYFDIMNTRQDLSVAGGYNHYVVKANSLAVSDRIINDNITSDNHVAYVEGVFDEYVYFTEGAAGKAESTFGIMKRLTLDEFCKGYEYIITAK